MASRGGPRPNSGRPKLLEAHKAQKICQKALMKYYDVSTMEEVVEAVLKREMDPAIRKFILGHAMGNIPQVVKNSHEGKDGKALVPEKIIVEVVRTEHNKNVDVENKDNDSL